MLTNKNPVFNIHEVLRDVRCENSCLG